ncbi:MAG TPA: SAF domain-containing protein [Mycobacteriales bacterium]|nr:SAF domain-containing protein [Mycobacteriales bacterium]
MPDTGTGAPPSPPAGRLATPRWLDARLVLGVLLVLLSVVVGARVLAAADRTQLVWTASRDLAAGAILSADDVEATEVRLLSAGDRYLAAPGTEVDGYVLERAVGAGELVPVDALVPPGSAPDLRFVSVPVLPGRYPADLQRHQLVDVWATPEQAPGASAGEGAGEGPGEATAGSRLVLEAVPVHAEPDDGGALSAGTAERAVVLVVPAADVGELVAAMSAARVDLVRVPTPEQARGAAAAAPGRD